MMNNTCIHCGAWTGPTNEATDHGPHADHCIYAAWRELRTLERKASIPCAMCLKPWQGNYSTHRDGMGVGPELPLCDGCGGECGPTCEEIWQAFRVCSQLIPVYDQGAIERARFIAHLEHASRIVKRWPSWKRDVLG